MGMHLIRVFGVGEFGSEWRYDLSSLFNTLNIRLKKTQGFGSPNKTLILVCEWGILHETIWTLDTSHQISMFPYIIHEWY